MGDLFGGSLFRKAISMDDDNNIAQIEPTETQAQIEQPANDSAPNAYETIIAQQQAQIEALITQTNTLTQQITNLVQNGAQLPSQPAQPIEAPKPQNAFNPKSLAETDAFLSMEDLAKEIGKR